MRDLKKILHEKFKLETFLEWQEEVIKNVIGGNDVLVFMPTWGWKSLTYQLPWVVLEGLTIVISPLISLMKDQIDKLNRLWIRSELINSTISLSEQKIILNELVQTDFSSEKSIKFLYIAPERLNSLDFIKIIQNLKISLVAIDEAHCISQWWHDFRPSYLKIKEFLEMLRQKNNFPIMALTATATKKVREDIINRLWLKNYKIFTKWFDRKNIIILVREISNKEEKLAKTLEIISKTPWSWIIYCSSRKMVDEVYEFLIANNISVWMYTWAMLSTEREDMQNKFMNEEYKVIVATNAFGMWIDKKDIRFVVHYNLPGSIESYYQEVGRAGRDGKKSYWVVLASYWDTKIQEFFIENTYPEKDEILYFYNYLYKDFKLWDWNWVSILKTYDTMAKESKIGSDMKVWSIIKIFEKYWILSRWYDWESNEWFRWRWITLISEKRKLQNIWIDWSRQNLLKNEAYFKLEQIKQLLFYPSCRKKFILEYFDDEDDLKELWDNCWVCDYCIDVNKFEKWQQENLVNLSVFQIVLDVVYKFDNRFWVNLISSFLHWNHDKQILYRGLDLDDNYWVLKEFNNDLIITVIKALISQDFIKKTFSLYPVISLTPKWKLSITREYLLKNEEPQLQSFVSMKMQSYTPFSKSKKKIKIIPKKDDENTYNQTLKLFKDWMELQKIAAAREMSQRTIEWHIVKLFEIWHLSLDDIKKLVNFENIKKVKQVIEKDFSNKIDKLRPIKDKLEEKWFKNISYFEIRLCIVIDTKESTKLSSTK